MVRGRTGFVPPEPLSSRRADKDDGQTEEAAVLGKCVEANAKHHRIEIRPENVQNQDGENEEGCCDEADRCQKMCRGKHSFLGRPVAGRAPDDCGVGRSTVALRRMQSEATTSGRFLPGSCGDRRKDGRRMMFRDI
jgi:hypothetical protein